MRSTIISDRNAIFMQTTHETYIGSVTDPLDWLAVHLKFGCVYI